MADLLPDHTALPMGLTIRLIDKDSDEECGPKGGYDTEIGEILIRKGEPLVGQLITLIHEATHACEVSGVHAGLLSEEDIEKRHDFTAMLANGLASVLIGCDLVKDITWRDWEEFAAATWSEDGVPVHYCERCGAETPVGLDPCDTCRGEIERGVK